ncbi:MAG: cytochrome c biogenesis protein CcsA, partial [Gammaproteobacteria bacterium]
TLMAFVLLTVSLVLGAIYTADISAQHLTHKIVFSVLAWGVFATLVAGRWHFGWRGRHAIRYVTAGFALLALAFFGTKIVLELILNRI